MFGDQKLYHAFARVCVPLSAQRHIDPHGDRHADRNLASTGNHCRCSSGFRHRFSHLEISAGHRKMVERRSGQ